MWLKIEVHALREDNSNVPLARMPLELLVMSFPVEMAAAYTYKLPRNYSITAFNLERNLESDMRRFVVVHCFTYPNIKLFLRIISKENENSSLTSDSIIELRDAM